MEIGNFLGKSKVRFLAFFISFFVLGFSILVYSQAAEDKSLTLPLGRREYRGKFLMIEPEKMYSTRTGRPVDFERMIKEMRKARFVYVGETHDKLDMH